jgi:hypothetical protein
MGLGQRSTATFLSIADGKIIRRVKEKTKTSIARKIARGPNAGNEVHEEHYHYIEGYIAGIAVKLPPKEHPEYGKKWNVTIIDGNEEFILQLDYSSGYSSAFLKSLPNVDFSQMVTLTPKMTMDGDKKRTTIFVNQGNQPIKWAWTKENPGELPPMKKMVFKGEEKWDDTDMMNYLEAVVEQHVVPAIKEYCPVRPGAASTAHLDKQTKETVETLDESQMEYDERNPPPPTGDDLPF